MKKNHLTINNIYNFPNQIIIEIKFTKSFNKLKKQESKYE